MLNVRSVIRANTSAKFQVTERNCENTNATVSTTRHDVVNTHTVAYNVQNEAANTRTTVSDIHPNSLKGPKDTRGQEQMVSTIPTLPVTG